MLTQNIYRQLLEKNFRTLGMDQPKDVSSEKEPELATQNQEPSVSSADSKLVEKKETSVNFFYTTQQINCCS